MSRGYFTLQIVHLDYYKKKFVCQTQIHFYSNTKIPAASVLLNPNKEKKILVGTSGSFFLGDNFFL